MNLKTVVFGVKVSCGWESRNFSTPIVFLPGRNWAPHSFTGLSIASLTACRKWKGASHQLVWTKKLYLWGPNPFALALGDELSTGNLCSALLFSAIIFLILVFYFSNF